MKYIFLFILFFITINLQGQIKPEVLPEDLNSEEVHVECYCQPGVTNASRSKGISFSYGRLGDGAYHAEDGTILTEPFSKYNTVESYEFKLKVPVILKDDFKMLIGFKHARELFNFSNIGDDFDFAFQELADEILKSSSISLIVSKPLNATKYLVFRLGYAAEGDYNQLMSFDQKYAVYKFFGLYAIKPHDGFEWGIGLGATKSFRRIGALPFILINKNFSKKWGMEAVLPAFVYGRYNMNKNNIFLLGVEYDSESYRLDIDNSNFSDFAYAYNHSEIIASVKLEHRFAPWIWGNARFGYQVNFSSDFESKSDAAPEFFSDPSNALFFKVGIFVSPE